MNIQNAADHLNYQADYEARLAGYIAEELRKNMVNLAERLIREAGRIQKAQDSGDVLGKLSVNSCGEVQGLGLTIDQQCAKLMLQVEHAQTLAVLVGQLNGALNS